MSPKENSPSQEQSTVPLALVPVLDPYGFAYAPEQVSGTYLVNKNHLVFIDGLTLNILDS